jgi:uncharacterized membrane-anchored protein YitT (DUF2179 family)
MFRKRLGRFLLDLLLIAAGSVLMAVAVNVFLNPNDVVPGGFTALAMIANRLWDWPIGLTLLVLNVPFLILGMWQMGAEFGPKTIIATALVSLAIDQLRPYVPTVQGEPLLYTAFGGLLYGLGLGLVFRANATSGGTEIPAKMLNRFYAIPMSKSLLAMDVVILGISAWFFGLTPALYALIVAWVMERALNLIETGINASQTVFVITENPEPVRRGILDQMERGVTLLPGEGGYTGLQRAVLFTVVNRHQVAAVREIVNQADPQAFMVINPSHEVLGEGFNPLLQPRPRLHHRRQR